MFLCGTQIDISPHPHNRLKCLLLVQFGIDFGDGSGAVAEDDAGGFQAKLLTQERGGVMAELVGVPVKSKADSGRLVTIIQIFQGIWLHFCP